MLHTGNPPWPSTAMNSTLIMSLTAFKLGLIKSCSASQLDREENRFISKLRTEVIGLNRIKVVR